jgi:two-component system, OmpR family, sensor histidine kinase VicK
MFKKAHIRIITIFFILGLVIITGLGIINIFNLNEIKTQIVGNSLNEIESKIEYTYKLTIILDVVYSVVCIIMIVLFSQILSRPITKLISDAEKMVSNDNKIEKNKNSKDDDEVVNAFNMMTEELKENLNEMTRQKKQIETIILHMTDGIIAFNMEGEVILVNQAATRLLQLLPKDRDFNSIFNRKIHLDINMEKIIYLENWTSSEQKVTIGDKTLNMFFAQFKDENDRPSGIMVLIQDITEHVKLDNMRKEFVADVSHELKTPITSIMGYADTLLEGEYDKDTQNKFLNVIAEEARRMAKLVTDLLTLSRFDNNQILQEKVRFDLGELVKQCQEKVQIEIDKKKHKVECFVTADVPKVYADKEGIERVVLNILTNSIKYTPDGGNIKIYVGFVYNDAYIKVIDNGLGIPEEDLSRIFERFYRVDKARTRQMGGTGLGLSIAKEILDKNNGSIDIKSQKGKGTEVVIRIPTKV